MLGSLSLRSQHFSDSALRKFMDEWIGLPYRYGGTTKKGIDCSAIVQRLYKEVYGLIIPRTSYYQKLYCVKVDRDSLQIGDIIFFNSRLSPSGRHVGVYIGDSLFFHAANYRDGVKISSLCEDVYRRIYAGAGRYYESVGTKPKENANTLLADDRIRRN